MTGVLLPPKSDLLALDFMAVMAIHIGLLKSIKATSQETLKNCVNMIINDVHVPLDSLISMLLFSTSSATNRMNLEESLDALETS